MDISKNTLSIIYRAGIIVALETILEQYNNNDKIFNNVQSDLKLEFLLELINKCINGTYDVLDNIPNSREIINVIKKSFNESKTNDSTIVKFKMAPINPNINGKYYDINSYKLAINNYMNNLNIEQRILYSGIIDNNNQVNVGKIININLENKEIEVELNSQLKFINQDSFVIGGHLTGNETMKDLFTIDKVNYFHLIPKEIFEK